jgi:HSP20 family molecular chaperone IbpA/ribosomal protein L21E
MKFKVDDKVKVIKKNIDTYWNKDMDPTIGLIGTIVRISNGHSCPYRVSIKDEINWWYQEDSLELIKEECKFKPGDRIKVNYSDYSPYIGAEGKFINYYEGICWVRLDKDNNENKGFAEKDLELVEKKETIEIGDLVKITDANEEWLDKETKYFVGKTGHVIEKKGIALSPVYTIKVQELGEIKLTSKHLKLWTSREDAKPELKTGQVVALKSLPNQPAGVITRLDNSRVYISNSIREEIPMLYNDFYSSMQLYGCPAEYIPPWIAKSMKTKEETKSKFKVGDVVALKTKPSEPYTRITKIFGSGLNVQIIVEAIQYPYSEARFNSLFQKYIPNVYITQEYFPGIGLKQQEKETKMANSANIHKEENFKEAIYTIIAPGKNKENIEVHADMDTKSIHIEDANEKNSVSCWFNVPERYNIEKATISIVDGIIKITIPVKEGVVIKLL